MNCDCVKKIDTQLKPEGRRLRVSYLIGDSIGNCVAVGTEWIPGDKPRRGKPGVILASYCPFCGTKTKLGAQP